MKKSFKLTILDQPVDVVCEKTNEWAEDGMGRSSFGDGRIRLNEALAPVSLYCTLFHEIVHYVADLLDESVSERQCSQIALAVYSFIKHNQKLCKEIGDLP